MERMSTIKITYRTVRQARMQQKQNPTSPITGQFIGSLLTADKLFLRSSCEKCVERAIYNMTLITTLRQHVFWFPCDVCRWRPEWARLQWSAVRLLLSDWQVTVCVCCWPAVRSYVPETLCSSVHTAHTLSQSPRPRPVGMREGENTHFSSKFHVNTGRRDFRQKNYSYSFIPWKLDKRKKKLQKRME